jgi:hypothetical protein
MMQRSTCSVVNSMMGAVGIFKQSSGERIWKPTRAQEEAALRLADSEGGFVRTRGNGATELRTTERGGFRRYVIRENGDPALVESSHAYSRFELGERFGAASMLLCFAGVAAAIAGEKLERPAMGTLGFVAFLAGLALFMAFTVMWSRATGHAAPPRAERWIKIGGPDH